MKETIIKIDIPKDTHVVLFVDGHEVQLSKKLKLKKINFNEGVHTIQIKEINLLEYGSTWLLNIIFIIFDIFTSINSQGEKQKLVSITKILNVHKDCRVTFCLHYGNCDRIISSIDDPEKICELLNSNITPPNQLSSKLRKRWVITNIIAVSIIFSIAIIPCILISVSSFIHNTEALPVAKIFFPILAVVFIGMAIHIIIDRLQYKY